MALTPSTIKASSGSRRKKKRVGRGNASQKGTFAGRGLKGQRSRSGGKSGGKLRGLKQALQKVPKNRGFKSLQAPKETVTLATLARITQAGDTVTPYWLQAQGVISTVKNGVKIVATGKLEHALTIKDCLASKTAVETIEKAGGKVSF
jgi:large subunit ribosomal protein L15